MTANRATDAREMRLAARERLREALDSPLLAHGYLPTESIEERDGRLVVELRMDRQEPPAAYAAKAILITEVLTAYPGYEVAPTKGPTASSVAWVLTKKGP